MGIDNSREPDDRDCDVVVVTVKQPELHAALQAFGVHPDMRAQDVHEGIQFWYAAVQSEDLGRELRVAVTMAGDDTNVPMVSFMHTVVAYLGRPGLAILTGTAAGVEAEVDLVDVVLAIYVTDGVRSRATETGLRPRPRHVVPSRVGERQIFFFDTNRHERFALLWREFLKELPPRFQDMIPANFSTDKLPTVYKGGIVSGDWLIEDGSIGQWRNDHDDRVYAGEMEGFGFALACRELEVPWFIIRGIADFGRSPRTREWQFVSSGAAAVVARRFVEDFRFHRRR